MHGPVREAQVIFQDGRVTAISPSVLDQYVTETANPHNELGVDRVEVRHPARLLAQGVVLIDTPGIGSTLAHNTATALDELQRKRHAFQAALVMVMARQKRQQAADLFAFAFVPLHPDEPPTRLQTPYWTRSVLMGGLGLPIPPGLWERLLPLAKRQQRILSRLQPLAAELALRNTEHLRWAVVQNTQQVLRQFQSHLAERLHS